MEIISPEQRKNKHCYFCGTGKSVKYVVEVNDYVLDIHPVKVYCCNKCVLSYNKKRATEQRRMMKGINREYNWLLTKLKETEEQPVGFARVMRLKLEIEKLKEIKLRVEKGATQMDNCKHHLEIPTIGTCCDAYSKAKRPDGKHWAHYPECKSENCPLLNPGLLENAQLETEE